MDIDDAVRSLAALAHQGRLTIFRLLVRAGDEGLAAGEIARLTGSLTNTLSANLNILSNAGLVRSRRQGRSIVYTAAYEQMATLLTHLVEDCCEGSAQICEPLFEAAHRIACCPPEPRKETA